MTRVSRVPPSDPPSHGQRPSALARIAAEISRAESSTAGRHLAGGGGGGGGGEGRRKDRKTRKQRGNFAQGSRARGGRREGAPATRKGRGYAYGEQTRRKKQGKIKRGWSDYGERREGDGRNIKHKRKDDRRGGERVQDGFWGDCDGDFAFIQFDRGKKRRGWEKEEARKMYRSSGGVEGGDGGRKKEG